MRFSSRCMPVSYTHLDVYKRQHNDLLKIFDFAALRGAAAFGVCFHKKCNAHFHQKLFTGTRSNIVNPIAFPGYTTKFDLSIS